MEANVAKGDASQMREQWLVSELMTSLLIFGSQRAFENLMQNMNPLPKHRIIPCFADNVREIHPLHGPWIPDLVYTNPG